MLVPLHSRCIRNLCARNLFVNHSVISLASFSASHPRSQSRPFHVGLTSSLAQDGTLPSHIMDSVAPTDKPKKTKSRKVYNNHILWSKNEKERFEYLYSDGRNPTIASIMAFFPGRTEKALYHRLALTEGRTCYRRWTPKEKARLLELHNAGATTLEMLKSLPGRTQTAILSQVNVGILRSYLTDKKRMVSSHVLKEEDGDKGGNSSNNRNNGAIVTAVQIRERPTFWTDEEDGVLRRLVQKAKERDPDRWTRELSRLLSDPKERKGLAEVRTSKVCTQRWTRLEEKPFLVKAPWTENEDKLLKNSIYSRLEIQLNSTSNAQSNTQQKDEGSHGSSKSKQPTGTLKNHMDEEEWPEISLEKMKTLDWKKVALDVGTRDPKGCRARFDSHCKIDKSRRWTVEETKLLKEGLRKYGRDWEKIASVVGTKTAVQARGKYLYIILRADMSAKGP